MLHSEVYSSSLCTSKHAGTGLMLTQQLQRASRMLLLQQRWELSALSFSCRSVNLQAPGFALGEAKAWKISCCALGLSLIGGTLKARIEEHLCLNPAATLLLETPR